MKEVTTAKLLSSPAATAQAAPRAGGRKWGDKAEGPGIRPQTWGDMLATMEMQASGAAVGLCLLGRRSGVGPSGPAVARADSRAQRFPLSQSHLAEGEEEGGSLGVPQGALLAMKSLQMGRESHH